MKNKPIQRITANNKELDGNIEVRNYLDRVEDRANDILDREDVQILMGEALGYAALWGHLMPDYKERLKELLNET